MVGSLSLAVVGVMVLAVVCPWVIQGSPSLDRYLAGPSSASLAGHGAGCTEPPLCSSPRLTVLGRLLCGTRSFSLPSPDTSAVYGTYAMQRVRTLLPRMVKGQEHSLTDIMAALERKLRHRGEPLVMHLAGDNGVGKTRTAVAVSLALALRCGGGGPKGCALGDSTLVLSGTAYDGLSVAEFRRAVVPVVVAHTRRFPHNGVVLVNELSSLEPEKVAVLLPLLGRGGHFPEAPSVDLAVLTVIVTTDFGREGRTRGRSVGEIRAIINAEFQELYSRGSTSYIRTFPFLPISLQTAEDIAAATVQEMGCHTCGRPAEATHDAVSLLVERVKPMLAAENGRAVVQQAATDVGPLVDMACDDKSLGVDAGATHVVVDVDNEGGFIIASPATDL